MFASSSKYADDFRAVLERVKAAGGLTSDIPAFAAGGEHGGGWMMAGEKGPELVATGAARVFDAKTTAAIMAGANADLSPKMMAKIVKQPRRGAGYRARASDAVGMAALIAWRGGRGPEINPSPACRRSGSAILADLAARAAIKGREKVAAVAAAGADRRVARRRKMQLTPQRLPRRLPNLVTRRSTRATRISALRMPPIAAHRAPRLASIGTTRRRLLARIRTRAAGGGIALRPRTRFGDDQ
jgi:hypothetical protein